MDKNKINVISIAHQKGGVGKTTNAVNISVELSKLFDVTVLDLDPQKHTEKFNKKRKNPFKMKDIKDDKDLINHLKNDKGLTIIDLGGYDSKLARTALLLTDLVITPLSDSSFELDGLKDFNKIMKDIVAKQPGIKCKVLINRVHHADKSTHRYIKSWTDKENNSFTIFDTIIPSNSKYKLMLGEGKAITELTSGTPSIIFMKLIDELIKDIKE